MGHLAESSPAIHHWLDIPIYAHTRTPSVSTALFQRNARHILIAVNNSQQAQDAVVDLFDGRTHRLHLAPKDGMIVEL